ncbi:MAG: phosphatase PAP2 family protein [Chthoniobacterales bacterium]
MNTLLTRTLFFYCLFFTFSLLAAPLSSKTYFLNTTSWNFRQIIPPPANKSPEQEKKDLNLLKDAMAARTKKQLFRALIASSDSVFDYASAISPEFTAKQLPRTAEVFKKVRNDTNNAIHAAKEAFHRTRPTTWGETKREVVNDDGYAYPSGHSTRAFVWAGLLTDLFPTKRKEIEIEARTKAWNRVILGRHYPDDVYGGELYGQYLAKQFLNNPLFQKEWALVKEEVNKAGLHF